MAKRALFVFTLELLNGKAQENFLEAKSGAAKASRAQREKKRIARKRTRAARRERSREAEALAKVVGSNSTACVICGRKFTSRKTFSKHACVTKEVEKARAA
ncbi:hypothetical protein AX15_000810 [Amanita polypyramis BW_CC]|nr:hypothetical protein AX15_000810 [Amanita polypyramis BW_CC]